MGRVEDVTLPARFITTAAHLIATLTIVYDAVRDGHWHTNPFSSVEWMSTPLRPRRASQFKRPQRQRF